MTLVFNRNVTEVVSIATPQGVVLWTKPAQNQNGN